MEAQQDKAHCLCDAAKQAGDTVDQTWKVAKEDKGVSGVVVFLRAPERKYFVVPANQRKRTDTVTIDQPFCAFHPRVSAVNPTVYDPTAKKQVETGQKVVVKNSAPILHNTAYQGNQLFNPGSNKPIQSKGSMPVDLKAGKTTAKTGEDLVNVSCDVHKWMSGKIAVFDHPYYAVTDEHGNYEIKNAPAGVPVEVCYWHETMGSLKNAKTKSATLKKGDNKEDFTVK
jgi:hypothetical protein